MSIPGRFRSARLLLLLLLLSACENGGYPAPPTDTTTPPTSTALPLAAATATASAVPATVPATTRPAATAPEWARDAVLYQVFVRAFTPEGTLAAAKQRLGDLKDLGVNLVYLMPVHP